MVGASLRVSISSTRALEDLAKLSLGAGRLRWANLGSIGIPVMVSCEVACISEREEREGGIELEDEDEALRSEFDPEVEREWEVPIMADAAEREE